MCLGLGKGVKQQRMSVPVLLMPFCHVPCAALPTRLLLQRPPGGYNITVYHTMHDEVNNYRTHVWSCTRW